MLLKWKTIHLYYKDLSCTYAMQILIPGRDQSPINSCYCNIFTATSIISSWLKIHQMHSQYVHGLPDHSPFTSRFCKIFIAASVIYSWLEIPPNT